MARRTAQPPAAAARENVGRVMEVAKAEQAGQLARRQPVSGIVTTTEGMKVDLTLANRLKQRPMRIYAVGLRGAAVKRRPTVHAVGFVQNPTRSICERQS